MKEYKGFIPPCGIYCGGCPNYIREKNTCLGAKEHCEKRKCKGIYVAGVLYRKTGFKRLIFPYTALESIIISEVSQRILVKP